MERDEVLLEAFAAELKARRAILKLSQEELAHRAGINRTYVAKIELAKNQPTLSVLHRLASALNEELPALLSATLFRYNRKPTGSMPSSGSPQNHPCSETPNPLIQRTASAGTRLGFTVDEWATLKAEARKVLIAAARGPKQMLTRSELISSLKHVVPLDKDDQRLFPLITEITEDEDTAGRPLLGAVVTQKMGNQVPDCEFHKTAKRLNKDLSDPLKYWLDELNRVCEYWRTHKGPDVAGPPVSPSLQAAQPPTPGGDNGVFSSPATDGLLGTTTASRSRAKQRK